MCLSLFLQSNYGRSNGHVLSTVTLLVKALCSGVGREGLSLQAQLGDTSTGLRTAFSFHRRMLDLAEGTGCLQYYHCDKGPFFSREISRLCLCYLPHPVCLENKSLRGRLSQSSLTDSLICPSHEETN